MFVDGRSDAGTADEHQNAAQWRQPAVTKQPKRIQFVSFNYSVFLQFVFNFVLKNEKVNWTIFTLPRWSTPLTRRHLSESYSVNCTLQAGEKAFGHFMNLWFNIKNKVSKLRKNKKKTWLRKMQYYFFLCHYKQTGKQSFPNLLKNRHSHTINPVATVSWMKLEFKCPKSFFHHRSVWFVLIKKNNNKKQSRCHNFLLLFRLNFRFLFSLVIYCVCYHCSSLWPLTPSCNTHSLSSVVTLLRPVHRLFKQIFSLYWIEMKMLQCKHVCTKVAPEPVWGSLTHNCWLVIEPTPLGSFFTLSLFYTDVATTLHWQFASHWPLTCGFRGSGAFSVHTIT